MSVWLVVYGNYEPAEIHSIWKTKERAEQECDRLDHAMRRGPWHVEEWEVGE